MATKEMLQDLLISFSTVFHRKTDDNMIKAYFMALRKYSDKEITDAAWRCLDDLTHWPKPADISQRIKREPQSKEDFFISTWAVECARCGEKGICIKEPADNFWECRQCYTGYTDQEIKKKFRALGESCDEIGNVPF